MCYAERLAATRLRHLKKYENLATMTQNGPRWSGEVQLDINEMKKVLKWRKPKRIFVCAMSDLFYEEVPDEFIEKVFAIMAIAQHHQFQILTKRPERMREWFATAPPLCRRRESAVAQWADEMGLRVLPNWPLPNVWLGISAENQEMANERIPELLNTPAAIRYISYEPALGPITFLPWFLSTHFVDLNGAIHMPQENGIESIGGTWRHGLDQVIVGAESGPGRRPCEIEWVKGVKDQCKEAGVAFFLKQLMIDGKKASLPILDGQQWVEMPGSVSSTK